MHAVSQPSPVSNVQRVCPRPLPLFRRPSCVPSSLRNGTRSCTHSFFLCRDVTSCGNACTLPFLGLLDADLDVLERGRFRLRGFPRLSLLLFPCLCTITLDDYFTVLENPWLPVSGVTPEHFVVLAGGSVV